MVGPGSFGGGHWDLEVASAQLKTALLLAGLTSGKAMQVWEPSLSRDHSERMLAAMGAAVTREHTLAGHTVRMPAAARLFEKQQQHINKISSSHRRRVYRSQKHREKLKEQGLWQDWMDMT